jgi:hypothetical protein
MNQEITHVGDERIATSTPIDFSVVFSNCIESVGMCLVATERARALVPAPFRLVGQDEIVTSLVILGVRGEIALTGQQPTTGIFAQIGLVIAPRDATGDVNVYTCWYYTSHGGLARDLRRFGITAQHVPTIEFRSTPGGARVPLSLVVRKPGRLSFVANWWASSDSARAKMTTSIPESLVGEANLTLTTDPRSGLGQLIGGPSVDCSALQRFNTFAEASLTGGLLPLVQK